MITTMIIDLATNLGQFIINMIHSAIPSIDIAVYMTNYTLSIISICTQANNFLHFMIGDFVVVLANFTITLLVFKYIIYPIITFIRSIFVNGNN